MEWLNYHHLLYFWTVAREGTVARASKHLGLAQPTISGQLKTLEDTLGEKLFARSGRHLVLADTPVAPTAKIRAFSHLLGECGVSFFGTEALASRYGAGFPRSLDGAPVLMPTETSALRRALDDWFHAQKIRPTVLGEFDDS